MPKEATEAENFQGMVSNVDDHDLEAGQARTQVNLWSPRPGELIARPGLRELTYD